MDILAAMGMRGHAASGFQYTTRHALDAQRGAASSGPVTLSALTNGLVVGTRTIEIYDKTLRLSALNCEVPELLNLLIHIHFTWVKTAGTYLYGQDPSTYSLVQESVGGRRLMIGDSTPRGLNVFSYFSSKDNGAGAQRKFPAIAT